MCKGICNVSMASRIETGERIPSRKIIEALFSRIGETPPHDKILMYRHDFEMRNLEYKIIGKISEEKYEIEDLLSSYRSLHEELTPLETQFYEHYYALFLNRNGTEREKALNLLVSALKITVKDFSISSFSSQKLYTTMEIGILNSIANLLYYGFDEKKRAIEFLEKIHTYFERPFINRAAIAATYAVILFNLSNWLGLEKDTKRALEYATKGLEISVDYGKLELVPLLLFNKGYLLAQLGNRKLAEENLKKSFLFFDEMNMHERVSYAAPILNKEFGFQFLEKKSDF